MDIITYALCKKAIQKSIETLGDVFTLKGNVSSVDELPSSGNEPGDIYLVGPQQDGSYNEYYWTSEEKWEVMGTTKADFDGVVTEVDLYKGENGTGTVENPAENTILDIVKDENNYTAGDYINITNNEISVTGIVPEEDATTLTNYVDNYFIQAAGIGYAIEIDPIADNYHYCSYTNTSVSSETLTFGVTGYCYDGELLHVGDSSNIATFVDYYDQLWDTEEQIQVTIPAGGTAYFQFYYDENQPPDTTNIPPVVKLIRYTSGVLNDYTKFTDTFMGTDGNWNGRAGIVPAPSSIDINKFLGADGNWNDINGTIKTVSGTINMNQLEGGIYAIAVENANAILQYGQSSEKSFQIGGFQGISAYLLIFSGWSTYMCFEVSGPENTTAKIHYGELGGKSASHLVFTLSGN